MPNDHRKPDLPPTRVMPTGDGYRSTAGSNYGDWRPDQPQKPHGYDFESRFGAQDRRTEDPDYLHLRREHERELDDHYPHWLRQRYDRFAQDFGSWRERQRDQERREYSEKYGEKE